ncbi:hypothetical protein EON65_39270, partial [archaeon]
VALDSTTVIGRGKRELSNIHWDLVIVDEAHKLKNYESKLGITLREEYVYNHCLLLTGTPLQNNTDELWTLLNFVDRDRFADREGFYSKYGELKTSSQLDDLYTTIRPYLLRREKDIVEKNIPPKEEVIIEVELTVPQKQYYRAIYEQKTHFLYKQVRSLLNKNSVWRVMYCYLAKIIFIMPSTTHKFNDAATNHNPHTRM